MNNTQRAVTLKIILGYFLALILAIISFWVIYRQFNNYTKINSIGIQKDKKLVLIGEVITGLYEAESLTRNIIQNADELKYDSYLCKIDLVRSTINSVIKISEDSLQTSKIDSINTLIDRKNKNLEEFIEIYKQRQKKGLQENVIEVLKKTNRNFGNYRNYNQRFRKFNPKAKKALIAWLEYSKKDNQDRLTNQTIDSLAASFYKALSETEKKEQKYDQRIQKRVDDLLKNDQIISKQLRALLSVIDRNERNQYLNRIKSTNKLLKNTTDFILVIGAISFCVALLILFLITRDISKSIKYRNDLEQEKAYTESLLKARQTLINTVTHDLRSPLNTVMGYSDILSRTILNTKQQHYLDHIKKSSDYILHLVNDLLDLSKLEAGKMAIEILPFVPDQLIRDTALATIAPVDKKDIPITVVTQEQLQQQYCSDPFRIKQVITNLVHNAYKFTESGSITIRGRIEDEMLVVAICDTGIGISQEQQQYVFEEFLQGDRHTEKKYGGFGLGLSITKRIVTMLGGDIALQSEIGKGSTFTVRIPIKPFIFNLSAKKPKFNSKYSLSDYRVLVVDDDPDQLALIAEVLRMVNLEFDSCSRSKIALHHLQQMQYQLIITDIQMPNIDGFELAKSIRKLQNYKQIPIVAVSGMAAISSDSFKNAGFTDYLQKPYLPNDLIALLSEVLHIQLQTKQNVVNSDRKTSSNLEYNLEELKLFTQNDFAALKNIISIFLKSTQAHILVLKDKKQTKDLDHIQKVAHKMLPMFKQIKAKKIIPLLMELENLKKDSSPQDRVSLICEELVLHIESLVVKLKKEVKSWNNR